MYFHLVEPQGKYRAEAEKQIAAANCRTRKDSVRVVETLITASPAFFKGKKEAEAKAFFEEAMRFLEKHQSKETIISAVVHMDEKTPHMHLSFVPLTADGRLSAKDIVGNKKKLTWWQDEFWKHMVKKYPELERGQSASETGRDYIPPRIFKEAAHLSKQFAKMQQTASEITPFNSKAKTAELMAMLKKFEPRYESYATDVKKYKGAFETLKTKNAALAQEAKDNKDDGMDRRMEVAGQMADYHNLKLSVERYAPELLNLAHISGKNKDYER